MTAQGDRQASFRAIHGGTGRTYNGDAMAAFQAETTIPAGTTFNGAFILWLRNRLGSSSTNINSLRAEWAAAEGATSVSGIGSFDPSTGFETPVSFDGTNDQLTAEGAFTGAVDTDKVLTSVFVRAPDTFSHSANIVGHGADGFVMERENNTLHIFALDTSFAFVVDVNTTTNIFDGVYHHVLFARQNGQVQCFLDDASETLTVSANPNGNLAFVGSGGVHTFGDTGGSVMDVAVFQQWQGTFLDISVQANRRLFINADGTPVDPATAAATLGNPIWAHYGSFNEWADNKGTGGQGLTLTGELGFGSTPVKVGE